MLTIEQRRTARRRFAHEVRQERTQRQLSAPHAHPRSGTANPIRVAFATPVLIVGGAEQWIALMCHWLDPDRATVVNVFVLHPSSIDEVAVSWLPRWVEFVDKRTIEQDGSFDVLITWGLTDLIARTSHLTFPLIDVQHGVFMNATWQNPLVVAATHAHEVLGTQIVGVNELVRLNFPDDMRDEIVIIPNGSDPARVSPLIGHDEVKRRHGLPPD